MRRCNGSAGSSHARWASIDGAKGKADFGIARFRQRMQQGARKIKLVEIFK